MSMPLARLFGLLSLLICLSLTAQSAELSRASPDTPKTAQVSQYSEFWLWPGARLPVGVPIKRLYLLQGFFSGRNYKPHFIDQGINATRLNNINELVLVYRLDALQSAQNLIGQIHQDLRSWERNNNKVIGVQLDFDSATGKLAEYSLFLSDIRHTLAPQYQLSITGLMDWANVLIDSNKLDLAPVDEIVLQTYQGSRSVSNIDSYLYRLSQATPSMSVPFKLGIVQGANLSAETLEQIRQNPKFRGFVLFLLQGNRTRP